MSKKKHNKKSIKNKQEEEYDLGFNLIYNPPDDGDWAEWIIENNIRFVSDVSLYDYQILRRLLLRGSGYVLNDIAKEPDWKSNPDLFGSGLSLNEYHWERNRWDERKYTTDYKWRKRFISDSSQYIQRREITNLDKFQVPLYELHLRRMTLFYGIQLFDEAGNMIFCAVLYKDSNERHLLVKQWFIDASKRLSPTNIIPKDAVLRNNTTVYLSSYPRFSVCAKTEGLNFPSFTTEEGNILAVPDRLPYKDKV